MSQTIIDALYQRNLKITSYLQEKREISLETDVNNTFRKAFVLSIASFFEKEICDMILQFVQSKSDSEFLCHFIQNKAISRQYHTFFDWKSQSANSFFGLFGKSFKDKCIKAIKSNDDLKRSVQAFLELGKTRNELVHLNFAAYQLEKTTDEYYDLYKHALIFIQFLKDELV